MECERKKKKKPTESVVAKGEGAAWELRMNVEESTRSNTKLTTASIRLSVLILSLFHPLGAGFGLQSHLVLVSA